MARKGLFPLVYLLGVGCSLAVDTSDLTAGDEGLECAAAEKVCPVKLEEPNGERECVSLSAPETSCGEEACGPCEVPGAVPRCTSGFECGVAVCLEGFADCDDDETNGCEVDVAFDERHCGGCDVSCAIEGAVATCILGNCEFVVCQPDRGNCDGRAGNGCEEDLLTSDLHCGACDSPCETGCVEGSCP